MISDAPSTLPANPASSATASSAASGGTAKPRTEEEAAKQFESVLVRQFVQVMTKDLFKSSLAGDDAMTGGQADMQRDVLTNTLTNHLVDSGALKLSDLLLRQWSRQQDDSTS